MQYKNEVPSLKKYINPFSSQVYKLEIFSQKQFLATATGFICHLDDKFFLITNWHVLSGRNPFDNSLKDEYARIPDQIKINYILDDLTNTGTLTLPLTNEDDESLWYQHPDGRDIDIAVLEIDKTFGITKNTFSVVNLMNADIHSAVGMQVFIVGFPYGQASSSNAFPIWKTGNIASEPEIDFDGKQAILVDATTREGMSGSPVILRSSGPYIQKSTDSLISSLIPVEKFMGIYSGRLSAQTGDDSKLSSELGIVWKPELIIRTIRGATTNLED